MIQASYEPHSPHPTDLVDPAQPGVSVGNLVRQSTGTLGAIVIDRKTGKPCILSNWHVLCGSTGAAAGDPIIQPGPGHLNTLGPRPVAQLLRWSDLSHGIDAAIAAIDPGIAFDAVPLGLQSAVTGFGTPEVGMHVVKSGTVTGVTRAIVDGFEGSFPMNYIGYGDTDRWMDAVRLVVDRDTNDEEISLKGDSGAIWIDVATNRAVALHFGGEDGKGPLAEYAVAHSLPRILDDLQIDLP